MHCNQDRQLGGGGFPAELLPPLFEALGDEVAGAEPQSVLRRAEHSNQLAEVRFADGRTLVVKRAPGRWAFERFAASRAAAGLLRRRAGILAPRHLAVPEELDECPVEAYWRIPLPTLDELWPDLPPRARRRALRSWGRLLRRVHEVELPGHGPIPEAARRPASLGGFLRRDLGERLRPAIAGVWPAGLPTLDALSGLVPGVAARAGAGGGVLVHNDAHMGNVLCEVEEEKEEVRCVGVLDLEDAFGGPAEADLARTGVLHGALFGRPLPDPWFERLRAGYGAGLDAFVLGFFRVYHLVNLGFHAALQGLEPHADEVARVAAAEVGALQNAESSGRNS